jgi:hypothetical protein
MTEEARASGADVKVVKLQTRSEAANSEHSKLSKQGPSAICRRKGCTQC